MTLTDTVTTHLPNGLSCDIPASSPLAKLLKSQRTWVGPSAKERLAILRAAKSIAIVGASPNAARSSYFVGTYLLQSSDYRVYFVNPNADTILGHKAYPDLASLPEVPDIVDVFRKASDIPSVIDDVLAVGAKTVWVQLGIWNQEAARIETRAPARNGSSLRYRTVLRAVITPVSKPRRCRPPWKRACSILMQRSITTVRPFDSP